jgi:hypothetical protein
MKKLFFILFCFSTALTCSSQELLATEVTLTVKNAADEDVFFPSTAIFNLNDASKQFYGLVDIFPAVPNRDAEDSLAQMGKPLQLKLTGIFPLQNMDFFTVADNGKSATMELTCNLNDVETKKQLTFYLVILKNASDLNNNDIAPHYQGRISFAFLINPAEYGLDQPPFAIKTPVMVNVSTAVINKID